MQDFMALDAPALIIAGNEALDRLAKTKLDKASLAAGLAELKELRQAMSFHGFETPYKGLEKVYEAIQSMAKEGESARDAVKEVLDGLKPLKYEAFLKKTALDRVKTATRAHEMALAILSEEKPHDLLKGLPFGGEWALKLEKMDVYARQAFFHLIDDLEKSDEEATAIVDYSFKVHGHPVEKSEEFSLNDKVLELLKERHGDSVEIARVQFIGAKKGLVKDKYSRTVLASAYLGTVLERARAKSEEELKDQIDHVKVKAYEKIVSKHDLKQGAEGVDVEAFESLQYDLTQAGFLNAQEELNGDIIDQVMLKKKVYTHNYYFSAKALMARDFFLHYLLKQEKEREVKHSLPGAIVKPGKEDLDILKVLEEEENKAFIESAGLKILPKATEALKEKLSIEGKASIPSPHLGTAILYKHSHLSPEEACNITGVDLEEFKVNASKEKLAGLKGDKLKALGATKTEKAGKFLQALKGKKK